MDHNASNSIADEGLYRTALELHQALNSNHSNALETVLRILRACKPTCLWTILTTVDGNDQTALMIAAANSNPGLMTILLDAGAEVNFQTIKGSKTALMVAAAKGDIQCARMLTNREANWCIRDSGGLNSIHYAVISGSRLMLKYCLKFNFEGVNHGDERGWTPLLRAIAIGLDESIIRTLLCHGANPNATDRLNNKSCLMVAAAKRNLDVIVLLLEHGANPFYRNSNGATAMHMAKGFGTPGGFEILQRAMRQHVEKLTQAVIPNIIVTEPFTRQVPEGSQPQQPSTSAAVAPANSNI